jgi:hypothetical protein
MTAARAPNPEVRIAGPLVDRVEELGVTVQEFPEDVHREGIDECPGSRRAHEPLHERDIGRLEQGDAGTPVPVREHPLGCVHDRQGWADAVHV